MCSPFAGPEFDSGFEWARMSPWQLFVERVGRSAPGRRWCLGRALRAVCSIPIDYHHEAKNNRHTLDRRNWDLPRIHPSELPLREKLRALSANAEDAAEVAEMVADIGRTRARPRRTPERIELLVSSIMGKSNV